MPEVDSTAPRGEVKYVPWKEYLEKASPISKIQEILTFATQRLCEHDQKLKQFDLMQARINKLENSNTALKAELHKHRQTPLQLESLNSQTDNLSKDLKLLQKKVMNNEKLAIRKAEDLTSKYNTQQKEIETKIAAELEKPKSSVDPEALTELSERINKAEDNVLVKFRKLEKSLVTNMDYRFGDYPKKFEVNGSLKEMNLNIDKVNKELHLKIDKVIEEKKQAELIANAASAAAQSKLDEISEKLEKKSFVDGQKRLVDDLELTTIKKKCDALEKLVNKNSDNNQATEKIPKIETEVKANKGHVEQLIKSHNHNFSHAAQFRFPIIDTMPLIAYQAPRFFTNFHEQYSAHCAQLLRHIEGKCGQTRMLSPNIPQSSGYIPRSSLSTAPRTPGQPLSVMTSNASTPRKKSIPLIPEFNLSNFKDDDDDDEPIKKRSKSQKSPNMQSSQDYMPPTPDAYRSDFR